MAYSPPTAASSTGPEVSEPTAEFTADPSRVVLRAAGGRAVEASNDQLSSRSPYTDTGARSRIPPAYFIGHRQLDDGIADRGFAPITVHTTAVSVSD